MHAFLSFESASKDKATCIQKTSKWHI